jgi:branched-chain amino acid transport system substrate-binding protein
MSSRWISGLAAAAAAAAVVAGCGSDGSGDKASASGKAEPVVVGVVVSKTGPFGDYGIGEEVAVKLAEEQIKAAGGAGGRELKFVIKDDGGKPDQAISVVRELIARDKAAIVLGPGLSTTAEAAFPIANASKVPTISPSIVSPTAAPKNRPWTFTIGAPADIIFSANLPSLQTAYPAVKKVALVVDPECAGCVAETAAMTSVLAGKGYEALNKDPIALKAGAPDQGAQATSIAKLNPDAVVGSAGPIEWALLAKELQRRGLDIPAFSGTGPSAPDFLKNVGDAGKGWTVLSGFWEQSPDPTTKEFVSEMRAPLDAAKSADAPINSADALYYDATKMVAEVIGKAKLPAGASIDQIRAAVRDGMQKVTYTGVAGEMSMQPNGRMLIKGYILENKDRTWQRLGN